MCVTAANFAVAVPVIWPVLSLNSSPVGNAGVTANNNGRKPPVAVTGVLLADSLVVIVFSNGGAGLDVNVIGGGAVTFTSKSAVSAWLVLSVTVIVSVELEAAVGVPDINPVAVSKLNPAANVPEVIEYTNGVSPPVPLTGFCVGGSIGTFSVRFRS